MQATEDRLLAFGDPDLKTLASAGAATSPMQTRVSLALDAATVSPPTLELARLPGSRMEVNGVARVRGTRPTDARLGSAATEAELRQLDASGELLRYRYLLFATHGLLNADLPLLSAIVLGRRGADDPNDGMVTALEWTGLRLASELTVLSACDSGLGRELPGEGIMGLPFALFVAGNRQTLLSLWPVPDRSTARFVTRFFELLTGGRTAADALAITKREFASQPGADDRVWAGFVLYGG
jgi:CHAT domain-containing protein